MSSAARRRSATKWKLIGLGAHKKTVITGAEMFRKELDEVAAGDNAGLLLRGVDKNELERGMVIAKPGSITPHKKFNAQVYVLKKEEGGRHTPFFNGYRPQFYFRTTDVTGVATLPAGTEMVMPGDNVDGMEVELIIADRHGRRAPLRYPRRRPHGRRRRCHEDSRVRPLQGVRLRTPSLCFEIKELPKTWPGKKFASS